MTRDEWRAPGRGGLGCDHPERLREDRRYDTGVREGQQVPEVAMLERPGEERLDPTVGGMPFERRSLRAEPHDDKACLDSGESVDENVNSLLLDQLAEVHDDRLEGLEKGLETRGIAIVGEAFLGVAGVRCIARRLHDQRGERNLARLWCPCVDVDAGRYFADVLGVPAHLGEHGADVLRADVRSPCAGEDFGPPGRQLRVAAHRVLEFGAVRLDGERRACCGPDRSTEEDVVREDHIGGQERPDRRSVRLDPAVEFRPGAVLDAPHLVPVVAVEDEDG